MKTLSFYFSLPIFSPVCVCPQLCLPQGRRKGRRRRRRKDHLWWGERWAPEAELPRAAILTIPGLNFVNRLGKGSCLQKTALERGEINKQTTLLPSLQSLPCPPDPPPEHTCGCSVENWFVGLILVLEKAKLLLVFLSGLSLRGRACPQQSTKGTSCDFSSDLKSQD